LNRALDAEVSVPISLSKSVEQLTLAGRIWAELIPSSGGFHVGLYRYSAEGTNIHVLSSRFRGENIFLWQLSGYSSLRIERRLPRHSILQMLHTEIIVLNEGEVIMLSPHLRAQQVVLAMNDSRSVLMEVTSEHVIM